MNILAIECAAESCSVALLIEDRVTQRRAVVPTQEHSRLILPMHSELLEEAGLTLDALDLIACGHGPGSFTGVRIATAITQGLAFGAGLPTLGVSTLAAQAWGACKQANAGQALVMLDARMDEVYWGHYAHSQTDDIERLTTIHADSLNRPEQLPALKLEACVAVGNGWARYGEALSTLSAQCSHQLLDYPLQAGDIASLAAWQVTYDQATLLEPEMLQPLYLRNQVTDQSKRRAQ